VLLSTAAVSGLFPDRNGSLPQPERAGRKAGRDSRNDRDIVPLPEGNHKEKKKAIPRKTEINSKEQITKNK